MLQATLLTDGAVFLFTSPWRLFQMRAAFVHSEQTEVLPKGVPVQPEAQLAHQGTAKEPEAVVLLSECHRPCMKCRITEHFGLEGTFKDGLVQPFLQ